MEPYSPSEFLQGFLEEADEHLRHINQTLLRLEGGEEWERVEMVTDLLRGFHTIKGLSGMVGLKEASRLSHALETVLLGIKRKQVTVTQRLIDLMLDGTRTLEAVIDTVRDTGHSMPDITQVVEVLQLLGGSSEQPASAALPGVEEQPAPASMPVDHKLLPGLATYPEMARALSEVEWHKLHAAARAGQSFVLAVFSPSGERAERGENVDLLRQQLAETGSIIKAVPLMVDGVFRFLFLVTLPHAIDPSQTIADEIVPLVADLSPEPSLSAPRQSPALQGRTSEVVRINLDRLDDLMRATGELVTLRSQLGDELARLEGIPGGLRRELNETNKNFQRALRSLRQSILRARMVPLGEVFHQMPLVARDMARASEKEVQVVIRGSENEVDKLLVERLMDPLIHLVRNAITHGIESPSERQAAGKARAGTLTLRGIPRGERILIEVEDDGRGIDVQKVSSQAGGLHPDGEQPGSDSVGMDQVLEWILRPGFTTVTEANLSAGRGIGLDVVANMVRSFAGRVDLSTQTGKGTTFRLELPLTLAIQDLLFVEVAGETYAIPRSAVERIIEVDPRQITRTETAELYHQGENLLVVHWLEKILGVPRAEPGENARQPALHGLLVYPDSEATGAHTMLIADRVRSLREVVVQPVIDPLVARPGIAGAADMGGGRVTLVLDVPELLHQVRKEPARI